MALDGINSRCELILTVILSTFNKNFTQTFLCLVIVYRFEHSIMNPSAVRLLYYGSLLLLFLSTNTVEGNLNTKQIVQQTSTAMSQCLNYQVIGECFWWKCNWRGCKIVVTPKVGHYRPDLVLSVYPTLDSHPWKEVKKLVKQSFKVVAKTFPPEYRTALASQGTEPSSQHSAKHRNLRYFEADAIGHPLVAIKLSGVNFFCSSAATPLIPYYVSLIDIVAWRNPEFESWKPQSLLPGKREIGRWPQFTWGSVYPRSGWVTQASPPKAAAVIAQRAADVAINGGKLRIRQLLNNTARQKNQWPPPALREVNGATGKFQMLAPTLSKSCQAFGTNDLTQLSDWGGGKVAPQGGYAWSLWRPYKCCPRGGQKFLGSDDVRGYP